MGPSAYFAKNMNAVVLNARYRLCDPGKLTAAQQASDIYGQIKWAVANADTIGIDPKKIILHGSSGGGHVVMCQNSYLAQKGESNLIALTIPDCAQPFGWFTKTDPATVKSKLVRDAFSFNIKLGEAYCTDPVKQLAARDPLCYPDQAKPEVMSKWPMTMIVGAEFDEFYPATCELVKNLGKTGRLLEYIEYHAVDHCFWFWSELTMSKQYYKDMRQAVDTYVR